MAGAAGAAPDPYRVWLSEIMLQQTTVATVGPYFDRFVARWPDISALAAASLDEMLHTWQGLGYYARARNLHACARAVVAQHGGAFPATGRVARAPRDRRLHGGGDRRHRLRPARAAVDGNVERVVARLYAVASRCRRPSRELRRLAAALVPERAPATLPRQ